MMYIKICQTLDIQYTVLHSEDANLMEEAMKNGVMLITYPDSLGSNLSDLETILSKHFSKALASLHILPFFPSSGGDRGGFAPYTYDQVDPAFGSWKDIDNLAKRYDLVFDYMINHISAQSPLLKEYLAEGPDSPPSKEYFIDYETFWGGGEPTEEQIQKIYKRKPKDPPMKLLHFLVERKRNSGAPSAKNRLT